MKAYDTSWHGPAQPRNGAAKPGASTVPHNGALK